MWKVEMAKKCQVKAVSLQQKIVWFLLVFFFFFFFCLIKSRSDKVITKGRNYLNLGGVILMQVGYQTVECIKDESWQIHTTIKHKENTIDF